MFRTLDSIARGLAFVAGSHLLTYACKKRELYHTLQNIVTRLQFKYGDEYGVNDTVGFEDEVDVFYNTAVYYPGEHPQG